MSESVIFPEMIEAGKETLRECRGRMDDAHIALNIYLAMRAIEEIALMREANETRH